LKSPVIHVTRSGNPAIRAGDPSVTPATATFKSKQPCHERRTTRTTRATGESYGVDVEDVEVSDFFAGVDVDGVDSDDFDSLVLDDELESPFFDSDVALDDGVVDDDLPRLSVL